MATGDLLRIVAEALVLGLVVWAPWPFGSVHPQFEWLLYAGIAALLIVWAAIRLIDGRGWRGQCPVALCFAGVLILGAAQLVALPNGWHKALSPAATGLYEKLLPSQLEQIAAEGTSDGLPLESQVRNQLRPLSVNPQATLAELIRLTSYFALFWVVRSELASSASFRRLSLALIVNGACLALFAILQFFGNSATNVLYWTFPTGGSVFGPFVCRNHYPDYANVCLGLGIGWLLSRRSVKPREYRIGTSAQGSPRGLVESEGEATGSSRQFRQLTGESQRPTAESQKPKFSISDLLGDTASLWACAALALIGASVALSLSRGGLMSLLTTICICAVLRLAGPRNPARAIVVAFSLAGAALFLAWFGWEKVEARMSTVFDKSIWDNGRFPAWEQALEIALDYPVLGAGYGSYQFLEPAYRVDSGEYAAIWENVHNDYLESAIDGGVVRLSLTLAALAFVLSYAYRGMRSRDSVVSGLATGGMIAIVALALHSFVDFGLRIPANALLASVVAAQVTALGAGRIERRKSRRKSSEAVKSNAAKFKQAAAIVSLVVAVPIAWWLVVAGHQLAVADGFRLAGTRAQRAGDFATELKHRSAAVQTCPQNPSLRIDLAEAQLAAFERLGPPKLDRPQSTADLRLLRDALANYLKARDICPLLAEPHIRLAAYANQLERGDSQQQYLDRALFLRPFDPDVCHAAALIELDRKDWLAAAHFWQRSLEGTSRHLQPALESLGRRLSTDQILNELLPARADAIVEAARILHPESGADDRRRPFLEKAVTLLHPEAQVPAEAVALAFQRRGSWEAELGRSDRAAQDYARALERQPLRMDWRYEYARHLHDAGNDYGALNELRLVLDDNPDHVAAKVLHQQLMLTKRRSQTGL